MEAMNQDSNTLTHITHLHPLHLAEVPATASPPSCHACGLLCTDSSIYRCAPCRYVMHVACARAAKTLRHAAHPDHPLSFRLAPPPPLGCTYRGCNACGSAINGPWYRCEPCDFDLHLPCAGLPEAVTVHAHAHPLKLMFEDPLKDLADFPDSLTTCDVCSEVCTTAQWFYYCEECVQPVFVAHVGCAVPEMEVKILYPAIDVGEIQKAKAAAAAAEEAVVLQQYQQQMSTLMSAQSSAFARNSAMIRAGQSLAGLAGDQKREVFYPQRRSYLKF